MSLSLEECIKIYMSVMDGPNLPDALRGKEKIIFGNIKSLYTFHKETFLGALERSKDSLDDIAKCFIDHVCSCMSGLAGFSGSCVCHVTI